MKPSVQLGTDPLLFLPHFGAGADVLSRGATSFSLQLAFPRLVHKDLAGDFIRCPANIKMHIIDSVS